MALPEQQNEWLKAERQVFTDMIVGRNFCSQRCFSLNYGVRSVMVSDGRLYLGEECQCRNTIA